MDSNTIIEILLGALGVVLWYLYREAKAKGDSNEKALLEFKVECANKYVTNDQLTQAIENLNKTIQTVANTVQRIENRLDNLVDSHRE